MSQNHIRPLIAPALKIDGQIPFKIFFKKNYKFAKVLKTKHPHTYIGRRATSKEFINKFHRVTKRMKLIFGLELHKALTHCAAQDASRLLCALKMCPNIKGLYLNLGGTSNDFLLQIYVRWFKVLKKLRSVVILAIKTQGVDARPFFKALKRKKLQALSITFTQKTEKGMKNFLILKHYPATLRHLAIFWKSSKNSLNSLSQADLSLSHMKSLTTLNLNMSMPIGLHQHLLNSIPHPINMKKITARTSGLFWNKNKNILFYPTLTTPFINLERLSLLLTRWFPISQAFIEQLKGYPLRIFELDCIPSKPINLVTLGRLIGSLEKLEILCLVIKAKKIIGYEVEECFAKFFDYLSQLKLLQTLRVDFISKTSKEAATTSIISHLAKCIEDYAHLKRFSFRFYQEGSSADWSQLLKVLKPKAPNLKSLALNFSNIQFEEETFKEFISFLEEAKSLKTLGLRRYGFHSAQQFEALTTCLLSLNNLNSLKFYKFNGELSKKEMAEFLKVLLEKPGFRKCVCTTDKESKFSFTGDLGVGEKVNIREIIKKNPYLQRVRVPFQISSHINKIADLKWLHSYIPVNQFEEL